MFFGFFHFGMVKEVVWAFLAVKGFNMLIYRKTGALSRKSEKYLLTKDALESLRKSGALQLDDSSFSPADFGRSRIVSSKSSK